MASDRNLPGYIRWLARQILRLYDDILGVAGAPVREADDLVPGLDPFRSDAHLRHNPGQVTTLARRESGGPTGMQQSFTYFRLTRVDRSGLHLDEHFSLSRLRNRD